MYAFVKAKDAITAYQKVNESLKRKRIKSLRWEFIEPYDINLEWEENDLTLHYKSLYNKAKSSNQCVFDRFCQINEEQS